MASALLDSIFAIPVKHLKVLLKVMPATPKQDLTNSFIHPSFDWANREFYVHDTRDIAGDQGRHESIPHRAYLVGGRGVKKFKRK